MAQIFHTGREEYASQPNLGFNPSEEVRQVGQDMVALEKYKQQLYMKREQEFLSLMDVKTDNLILEKFQTIAADEIDKLVNEGIKSFSNKSGILSTQDKMELMKKRQQMELKVDGMRAKAKQFLDRKEMYAKRPELYDIDETNALFNEFAGDPVNKPVPNPVPKYYDPVYLTRKLADSTYKYGPASEENIRLKDGSWTKAVVQKRVGIENEDDAKKVAREWYENEYELTRSVVKTFKGNFDAYYEDVKDILLPREYQKMGTRGGGGLSIGFNEKDINFYTDGGTIKVTGTPKPFGLTVDNKTRQYRFVSMNKDKITVKPSAGYDEPDKELTDQILKLSGRDNSSKESLIEGATAVEKKAKETPNDKIVMNIYKKIYDLNAVIYDEEDGRWYFKKQVKELELPNTEENRRSVFKGQQGYSTFVKEYNAMDWGTTNTQPSVPTPNPEDVKDKWKGNKR